MNTNLAQLPGRPELLAKIQRSLEQKWNSKENYTLQLGLNIPELISQANELFLQHGKVEILDIWWNASTAILDLKELFAENGIPKDKIMLNKVDLYKVQQAWVNFLEWNLEDDDFLIHMVKQLWEQSQWIIFMNQVSQYLSDRLKVIKVIWELLLKKWGTFHFNLVTTSFYSGNFPLSMMEQEIYNVIEDGSSGFDITLWERTSYSSELRLCKLIKYHEDAELEAPWYRRKTFLREWDGLVETAYNLKERTSIKDIRIKLATQNKIAKLI